MPTTSNRLSDAISPYLRQHADNPVAWQPWETAAFAEAKRRDLPVLVSIGYSTCHWCHVMAHESFEDPELAELMNAGFVCIKVDREEHPEVDAIYMDVCQAMNGQGGWPLHAICDSDGVPFFAGTYFPPPQWRQVLTRVSELWQRQRDDLHQQAQRIHDWLRQDQSAAAPELLRQDLVQPFIAAVQGQYDQQHPGFGSQPKFPPSCALLTMLALEGGGKLDPIVQTVPVSMLTAMQDSGLHDRVGGGFHRYSVDAQWRVPHFEKMLYDNALLMTAYAQAAQQYAREDFLDTARAIGDYLLRDMRVHAEDGTFLGYAAAEDADDPGGEGSFYAWSPAALREVLGEEAEALIQFWDLHPGEAHVGPSGHREPVTTHIPHPRGSEAFRDLVTAEQLAARQSWREVLPRLRQERERRPRPGRDDKVLTDLNGLTLQGFAWLARATGELIYYDATRELATALQARALPDGLLRMPERPAYITDYGHLLLGLTAAYQALGEVSLITRAETIAAEADWRLSDGSGGFYATPAGREDLLRRGRDLVDNPAPGGSNALALGLVRLGQLTGSPQWLQRAEQALVSCGHIVQRAPTATATAIQAWWHWRQGPRHAVVAGPDHLDLLLMTRRFAPPGMQVVAADSDADWPCLEGRRDLPEAQVLICAGSRCLAPARNERELRERLALLRQER